MPSGTDDHNNLSEDSHGAIARVIRPATRQELLALGEQMFPFVAHPWRQQYVQFLEENRETLYLRMPTDNGIGILYCLENHCGLWFQPGCGVGILHEVALRTVRNIVGQM